MLDEMDVKILQDPAAGLHPLRGRHRQGGRAVDHALLAPHPEAGGDRRHRAPRRHPRCAARQRRRHRVRVDQDRPAFARPGSSASTPPWSTFPEVVEFYRMSGEVDYLLHVVVPDIAAYDAFYKKLISRIEISKVSSAFAMEQIKYTTALPLDFALPRAGAEGGPAQGPGVASLRPSTELMQMAGANANIGVPPLEALKAMSGLEFLRRIVDGRLPQPPITETLGFTLDRGGAGLRPLHDDAGVQALQPHRLRARRRGGDPARQLHELCDPDQFPGRHRLHDAGDQGQLRARHHRRRPARSAPRAARSTSAGGRAPPRARSSTPRARCLPTARPPA